MIKKSKQSPETRTVFGIKCKKMYYFREGEEHYWRGSNKNFEVSVYDRDTRGNPWIGRFFVVVKFKTFHNIECEASANTLHECIFSLCEEMINIRIQFSDLINNLSYMLKKRNNN